MVASMSGEINLSSVGERIEALVAELGASADPVARAKAEDLLQLVMRFYGAGLERMLEIVDEGPDEDAERLFGRFADDPLVASVLLLHGLHPLDVDTRVRAALQKVRAHGADVDLLEVQNGIARISVKYGTNGRGPSSAAIRQAIEQALLDAVPEVTRVDLEGLEPDPPAPLIQLSVGTRARSNGVAESAQVV